MELDGVDFGNHGIIYVTQGHGRNQRQWTKSEPCNKKKEKSTVTEWTNPATEELLRILKKHYQVHAHNAKFGSKRILYENCSLAMKKKGFRYTASQCENKWKSLKRRYLTCYNRHQQQKGKKRTPYKKQLFDDEIEFILKFDKPPIKKELNDSKRNLSLPPGYDEDMDQDDENNESDENEQKYTQTDEQLVHMMLKGSDDEDQKDSVFTEKMQYNMYPQLKQDEASAETSTANDSLINEVREFTSVMKNNVEANTNLLKSHSASYEQILVCLDSLDRKADEKIEIERKKLEKQGEMLQQSKILNSLLAKIVQKLGNANSSGNK